jgi:predicted outer membrane repeat protein
MFARIIKPAALSLFALLILAWSAHGEVRFVDRSATGAKTGLTWDDAWKNLQTALRKAALNPAITEIWVAEGTYNPGDKYGRSTSFELVDGVKVLGGFISGGGLIHSRDPDRFRTILSGDIGVKDNFADNNYHVVTVDGQRSVTLDGFQIKFGNADAFTGEDSFGGGISICNGSSIFIKDCLFKLNTARFGGAVSVDGVSEVGINSSEIKVNYALIGGGIYTFDSSSTRLDACLLKDNYAVAEGGGVYSCRCSLSIYNSVFFVNRSGEQGGAVYVMENIDTFIVNATFVKNRSSAGGGAVYAPLDGIELANSILWRNAPDEYDLAPFPVTTVRNCCIHDYIPQPGWTDVISTPPRFADKALRIRPDSPCIDSGDNAAMPHWIPFDRDGNPRIVTPTPGAPLVIDIGAYEVQEP